jgi:hypothetical protein
VARIIWRDMMDQELQGVRAMLARLETAQAHHSEALRSATALWAEQIGYLRARTQGLGEASTTQRADLQGRLDELHRELSKLEGMATQTHLQAQSISQLDREQARISLAVAQLAEAHTELLERIEGRFDRMQGQINHHSKDLKVLIGSIFIIMLSVVFLAVVVSHGNIFG